jgi:hypothetical protein
MRTILCPPECTLIIRAVNVSLKPNSWFTGPLRFILHLSGVLLVLQGGFNLRCCRVAGISCSHSGSHELWVVMMNNCTYFFSLSSHCPRYSLYEPSPKMRHLLSKQAYGRKVLVCATNSPTWTILVANILWNICSRHELWKKRKDPLLHNDLYTRDDVVMRGTDSAGQPINSGRCHAAVSKSNRGKALSACPRDATVEELFGEMSSVRPRDSTMKGLLEDAFSKLFLRRCNKRDLATIESKPNAWGVTGLKRKLRCRDPAATFNYRPVLS